jgi:hypothetical protein
LTSSAAALPDRGLSRAVRWLPALIAVAGALALVMQWRFGRMLWLDEEMIAINIRDRSAGELMGALSLGQAAPYGWLLIERMAFRIAGDGERTLRFVPMFFGVATIAVAWWIGRRWMGLAAATALVFLCGAGQWLAFHALELKHYSADACFGLLLPALAAWAIEPPAGRAGVSRRRLLAWWTIAAAAQWVANGALFAAPACAAAMLIVAARRWGWRGALDVSIPGIVWLAAFAENYAISLGPVRASDFLQSYWRDAFPPPGSGAAGTMRWLAGRAGPLATKPGGTTFGLAFWAAAAAGWFAAPRYPAAFRAAFALVPLSAFFWAGVGLVPMFERLSLWMIPALYVGVAMSADATAALLRSARARHSAARAALGLAAAGFLVAFAIDVQRQGRIYFATAPYPSNHTLDDRGAVRWLERQRRAGDVWITTHNALPAIWWYAESDALAFEAALESDDARCAVDEIDLRLRAAQASRALVYFGFGHDTPPEFDDALAARLGALGRIEGYRRFGEEGHALVVDLGGEPSGPVTLGSLVGEPLRPAPPFRGCVVLAPARRW